MIILLFFFIKWKNRWKGYVGFVLEGDPSIEFFRSGYYSRNRYFHYPGGLIDLSKKENKKLIRVETDLGNEYLIEAWDRTDNLYLKENGKEKIVIFEFLQDKDGNTVAINCLRTLETIIRDQDPGRGWGTFNTSMGVCWDSGKKRKVVKGDNLLGVVKYESIQNKRSGTF